MKGGVVGVVELHGYRKVILTFQSVIYKVVFKSSFFFSFRAFWKKVTFICLTTKKYGCCLELLEMYKKLDSYLALSV